MWMQPKTSVKCLLDFMLMVRLEHLILQIQAFYSSVPCLSAKEILLKQPFATCGPQPVYFSFISEVDHCNFFFFLQKTENSCFK